jgi:hypothetical protein
MVLAAEPLEVSLFSHGPQCTLDGSVIASHTTESAAQVEAELLIRSGSMRNFEPELVSPSTALFNAKKLIESVLTNNRISCIDPICASSCRETLISTYPNLDEPGRLGDPWICTPPIQ